MTNAIKDHVDEDDKRMMPYEFFRGYQNGDLKNISHYGAIVINESGLYSLIFGSRLESAKRFKHWITHEVIPSIRRTGSYMAGLETLSNNELIAKAFLVANGIIEKKDGIIKEQQMEIKEQRKEIKEKDRIITEGKDKVEYFDKLCDTRTLTSFRDAGNLLGMSQTQFTGWLMRKKYIYRTSGGELRPTEPYRKSDLFRTKSYVNRNSGHSGIQTCLTPRGIQYFKMILEDQGIFPDALPKHGGRKSKKNA